MPAAGLTRMHTASSVSEAVPGRIARALPASLQVHSIFRSVVNISTADGLLTIASPEAGGLANGVLVDIGRDWRSLGLEPGMPVRADFVLVRVPDVDLEIRLDAAPRWSPRFPLAEEVGGTGTARWRRRATATRVIASARVSAGGFGALLREDATDRDPFRTVDVARPIIADLIVALETGDPAAAARIAVGLIGLGPGLTPSGDDALVGIEASLHALHSPMAGFLALAVDDVEQRTTALAATLLRHAAAGEFAERLHTLLGGVLGPDESTIVTAIDRAVAWGATSGTDCLLGVLIGLDVATGVRGVVH